MTRKTTTAKATTGKATAAKATARKARTKRPAFVRFPNSLLAAIDVAVEGPVGPGGIAHRIVRYPIVVIDHRGERRQDELVGAACQPTTTRPVPNYDSDDTDDDANVETVPVTVCRCHGAAYVQSLGVTRCTHDACWPLRPGEPPEGGRE